MSETSGAEGESESAIPDKVTQIYWDTAQLILSGNSDQLPKPTVPRSTASMPGYAMDIVQYDEQFRLATDLSVLAITPEFLMKLSALDFVKQNTYTPPNTGPVLGDALTYSRIVGWLNPAELEKVLQLDYVMAVDFSTYGVVNGEAAPATPSFGSGSVTLNGGSTNSPAVTAGKSLDKIDERVFAAFAGDPSVAMPKVIYSLPAQSAMPGLEEANGAAGMFGVVDGNGTLYVQIDYEPGDVHFANVLATSGVQVGRHYDEYGIMEAWVNETDLAVLSQLGSTKLVVLPSPTVIRTAGPSTLFIDSGNAPPDIRVGDDRDSVVLQVINSAGQPVSSVNVGDEFQSQGILVLSAPAGVLPFAAYADLRFPSGLVKPSTGSGDFGLLESATSTGLIDEAGGIVYDPSTNGSSSVLFRKTFVATKKGTATFTSDAADLYGHDIYVTGLDFALPHSQVKFQSANLQIKPKNS